MGKRRKVRIGSPRALLLAVVVALLALVLALIPPVGPSTAGAEIVAGPTPWPGGTWQPDPATYGMTVESNIQLPMDDGVVLIANVGYPSDLATGQKASGTFPVLLTQSPYVSQQQPDTFFVSRGYINAVVQVRGTGDTYATNGGPVANDLFGERQTKDSVALVDWAARLPGSNGKLGLDGCSFLGIDQIFTAAAVGKDSPIEDILPACASNGYDNYFSGGMPSQIAGLFGSPLATSVSGAKHAEESISSGQAMLNEILAGGPRAYNREYWRERTRTASPTRYRRRRSSRTGSRRSCGAAGPRRSSPACSTSTRSCRTRTPVGRRSGR